MTYRVPWLVPPAAVLLCLALAAPPSAGDPGPRRDPFAEAVEQLGSIDPGEREGATRLLWNAGIRAEPALRRAAEAGGAEPEVAARARVLLEKIESGVRPDTPQKALDFAVRYKTNPNIDIRLGAARGLIDLGDVAAPMLLRLWAREPDPKVKAGVLKAMLPSCARYARLLLIDGDDATAEQLLEAAADARGGQAAVDYAAYLAARGRVKQKIAELTRPDAAPAGVPGPRPSDRHRLGWLHLADGDAAAAIAVARDLADPNLLRTAHYNAGDWAWLATTYVGAGEQEAEPVNALNLAAALYRMAGDEQQLEAHLQKLRRFAAEKPQYAFICAETFFAVGRAGEAIELLRPHDPAAAFSFLCHQLRFDDAFALAGEALGKGAKNAAWVHAAVARQYAALGEREKFAVALTAALVAAAAQGPQALAQVTEAAVEIEAASGERDKAVERALSAADDTARAALVARLFPSRQAEARFWWRALRARPQSRDETARATFDRLSALLGRKAAPEQVEALCAAAADAALEDRDGYARGQGIAAVSDLLRAYGLDAPAADLLQRAARSANAAPDALLRLGDLSSRAKRWDEAAAYYERARTLCEPGRHEEALATYLQGWALKMAGRDAESLPLIELGRALPLGNDGARHALCAGLEERGLKAEAAEEGKVLMRLHGLWSLPAADAARRAAGAAADRRDFAAAAGLLERSLLGVVRQESGFSRQEGYLTVPRAVETYRALAKLAGTPAAEAGTATAPATEDAAPAEGVAKTLRSLVAVFPAETDWTIRCVAELDRSGRRDLGDGLFEENARLLRAVCDRHPAAAQYHNSLAWLSARCGRDLDGVLAHAGRAVELRPANPAFLDTLAEAHFRRGDTGEAVRLIKQCLETEPGSAYLQGQLKRFESPPPQK